MNQSRPVFIAFPAFKKGLKGLKRGRKVFKNMVQTTTKPLQNPSKVGQNYHKTIKNPIENH